MGSDFPERRLGTTTPRGRWEGRTTAGPASAANGPVVINPVGARPMDDVVCLVPLANHSGEKPASQTRGSVHVRGYGTAAHAPDVHIRWGQSLPEEIHHFLIRLPNHRDCAFRHAIDTHKCGEVLERDDP